MDRFQALDILDALPPDRRHAPSSEVEEARRALEADAEGRRQLDVRRQLETSHPFDIEVRRAMRELPVPADARERLFARLAGIATATQVPAASDRTTLEPACAADSTPCRETQSVCGALARTAAPMELPQPHPARRSRILSLGRVVVASAVVLVALLAWSYRPRPIETVALAEVRNGVLVAVEDLPPYANVAFPPRFPDRWPARIPFDIRDGRDGQEYDFREVSLGASGQVKAALCGFQLADRGRSRASGYLIVLPTARMVDPPLATSFTEALATPHYTAGMASVTWTDGDAVFVCMIRGEGNLKLLERALGIRLG